MVVRDANWNQRLVRAVLTADGRRLRTLGEAAAFVAEQNGMRQHWLSATQALIFASFDPNAAEGATAALERALGMPDEVTLKKR